MKAPLVRMNRGRFCVGEEANQYVEFRGKTKYMVIPDQDMYDLGNITLNETGRKGYVDSVT